MPALRVAAGAASGVVVEVAAAWIAAPDSMAAPIRAAIRLAWLARERAAIVLISGLSAARRQNLPVWNPILA
jgi:hypothetical protein